MDGLIMTAQVLLSLSILVGLHEFGHLIAAKIFGMRVEKYSIGFPPKIWGFKSGETEYSIGAIPLGGYVKISGMIDESLDTNFKDEPPKHWEYRSKPAWQRLIVMMGGITVNIITGIVVFAVIAYQNGDRYIPRAEMDKYGIVAYELGQEIGLETGDKITKLNGRNYDKVRDLKSLDVLLGENAYYTVHRADEELKIYIPSDFIEKFASEDMAAAFFSIRLPFQVGRILPGYGALEAGLLEGDKIHSLNNVQITYFDEVRGYLSDYSAENIDITVERAGQRKTFEKVILSEDNKIGFEIAELLDYSTVEYSMLESIPVGTQRAFGFIGTQLKAFGKMFRGELNPAKSLSGPIGIARNFGDTWNWRRFWTMTGFLSMVLAFMNFLPIPALDGGHVAFLIIEIVSGRKPSDSFLENAQKVGLVVLLSLMVFVIGNDLFKLFF